MEYIDLGQNETIFDKFNLSFKERATLTRLTNKAFQTKEAATITETIMSYVRDKILEYARANSKTQAKALEALDYLLILCRNRNGKPFIPVLSKLLNAEQHRISGGVIKEGI